MNRYRAFVLALMCSLAACDRFVDITPLSNHPDAHQSNHDGSGASIVDGPPVDAAPPDAG